jgi:hypothetical protein
MVHLYPAISLEDRTLIQIGKNAVNKLFLEVPSTTQTRTGLGQLLFAGTEAGAVAKLLGQTPLSIRRMMKKPVVDIPAIFLALVRLSLFSFVNRLQGYRRLNSNKDKNERVRQFFVLKAPNPSGRDKRYYVGSAESFYDEYKLWASANGALLLSSE